MVSLSRRLVYEKGLRLRWITSDPFDASLQVRIRVGLDSCPSMLLANDMRFGRVSHAELGVLINPIGVILRYR